MALSFQQYSGDGANRNFPVGFSYISRLHVSVTIDGTPAAFAWLNPQLIQTVATPGYGQVVEVRRTTPRDTVLVDFVDGSTLTETDLDTATLQTFFLSQEAFDIAGGTLGITSDGSYSANNRRISNVRDPVDNQDAVTKRWVVDTTNTNVALAIEAKQAAQAAQADAVASRDTATWWGSDARGSATTATQKATDAGVYAGQAAGSAATATGQANTAIAQVPLATAQADRAKTEADRAADRANAASASADRAAQWDPNSYITKTGGTYTGLVEFNAGAGFSAAITARAGVNFGNGSRFFDFPTEARVTAVNNTFAVTDPGQSVYIFRVSYAEGSPMFKEQPLWHSGTLPDPARTGVYNIFSAQQELQGGYPALWFHFNNIKRAAWMMHADGRLTWYDQSGTVHHSFGPGGDIWTQQFGDLNTHIENRAYAWADARGYSHAVNRTGDMRWVAGADQIYGGLGQMNDFGENRVAMGILLNYVSGAIGARTRILQREAAGNYYTVGAVS
jgi:hypothetical protein